MQSPLQGCSTDARSRGGLLELAYRAVGRLMTCDITRLMVLNSEDARPPQIDPALEIRFLSAEEVARFACDPANDLDPSFAERMTCRRDVCCAALDDGQLAAYAWLALGSIEADMNRGRKNDSGVALSFNRRAAFVYKAYTRPEYRGLRLYAACLADGLASLQPRGVRQLLATAEWTNRAALSACHGLGFRDLGTIVRLVWGPLRFTRGPRAGQALGIRLGRRARVHPRIVRPEDASSAGAEGELALAAAGKES